MTLRSMTGFSDRAGALDGVSWIWEARSVNGRGLELRLRLPDGTDTLEPAVRKAAGTRLSRGSVTVSLRLGQSERGVVPRLNPIVLNAALAASKAVQREAEKAGVTLAPMTVADLLAVRGVLEVDPEPGAAHEDLRAAFAADIEPLFEALAEARAAEGAALATILLDKLDAIERLGGVAQQGAEAISARSGSLLRKRVAAILEGAPQADDARLAQELALLAVKADITEELDRLMAHVEAARVLIMEGGPVGRWLDFLIQEFNREANTVASKAQSFDLTSVALEIKVLIDQMREQVQNVE